MLGEAALAIYLWGPEGLLEVGDASMAIASMRPTTAGTPALIHGHCHHEEQATTRSSNLRNLQLWFESRALAYGNMLLEMEGLQLTRPCPNSMEHPQTTLLEQH